MTRTLPFPASASIPDCGGVRPGPGRARRDQPGPSGCFSSWSVADGVGRAVDPAVDGLEGQADRVDAVAVAGGRAVAVGEDVAEVRPAVRAADLDPLHAVRAALDVLDRVGDRLVERRPP